MLKKALAFRKEKMSEKVVEAWKGFCIKIRMKRAVWNTARQKIEGAKGLRVKIETMRLMKKAAYERRVQSYLG
jgi:hypothetical protein